MMTFRNSRLREHAQAAARALSIRQRWRRAVQEGGQWNHPTCSGY